MENDKIKKLYALILKNRGKTSYLTLAKRVGFTAKDAESIIIFRMFELAKYAQSKLIEAEKMLVPREDAHNTLSVLLHKVSTKMLEYLKEDEFALDDAFRKKMNIFSPLFKQYVELEGFNKPVTVEHTLVSNYDLTKLTTSETETFLMLHNKAKL